jgi:hypothetical protein
MQVAALLRAALDFGLGDPDGDIARLCVAGWSSRHLVCRGAVMGRLDDRNRSKPCCNRRYECAVTWMAEWPARVWPTRSFACAPK